VGSNVNDQLVGLAQPALEPGEEILGVVRVNYNGTMQPNSLTINASTVGGDAMAPPDADALVAFPSAQQMGLVLTGGRILVWSLGFSRKPKAFIGEVPLTAIGELHAGAVSFGPLMRVVMRSGATVDLEIPNNEAGGDAFIDQLHHLVGEGSDSRSERIEPPPAAEAAAPAQPGVAAAVPPPQPPPPQAAF
jgi:hypothetical protein